MSETTLVHKLWPTLYKSTSKGKEQLWQIAVETDDIDHAISFIRTTYGQVDGKMQTARVAVTEGKNLGKKNATTPMEQALAFGEAKWKKQLDKGYSESRGGGSMSLKPMLAQKYEDRKHKVVFPAWVQPKLDGVRALAVRKGDSILLLSRQGKEHKGLEHIRAALKAVMGNGEIWDGELYVHGMPFQEVISLVKKPQDDSEKVQYHVYDKVSAAQFDDRNYEVAIALDPQGTESFGPEPAACLVRVPTLNVADHDEVAAYHQMFVERGYEGVMLRWGEEGYKSGYRSEHLLKCKSFQDGEFEIVDVVPGVGKESDKGTFVCKTAQGATFNCRPRGSDELRASYLAHKNTLIGLFATVRFFEWTTSENRVPRFPVAVAVRDYE